MVLYSGIGAYFFGTAPWQFDIYGVGVPGVVVVFLVLLAIVLWRLLFDVSGRLRDAGQAELVPGVALGLGQPRRLALWAAGLLLVLTPLGALYGPLLAQYTHKLLPLG